MSKYRIVKEEDRPFYVQKKGWLFWHDVHVVIQDASLQELAVQSGLWPAEGLKTFPTFEHAQAWIEKAKS